MCFGFSNGAQTHMCENHFQVGKVRFFMRQPCVCCITRVSVFGRLALPPYAKKTLPWRNPRHTLVHTLQLRVTPLYEVLRNTPLPPWSLSKVAGQYREACFFKCVLVKGNLRSSPRHCLFGRCVKWTARQNHEALPAGICVV